ncbi:sarcosine oxidase subunit alpha family protein [Nocardioides sp. LMS-CY]|uniref:sarcosine oxidase subunit alpha family protein n=1 Tax=Nocardioides sp. (strain LMS-CY) TaxID=2840457 RepID=UPI001BFFE4E1|nr:sarcosine oxidase subunit alpha family protein [Nocardioides sp. LMS-CY]
MSDASHRLPTGGRIDRRRTVTIRVDEEELAAHPGDTVASALLAHGRLGVAPSLYHGRPRGIIAAGVEEPNAMVCVIDRSGEALTPATTLPVRAGLAVETRTAMGRLDTAQDNSIYDKRFQHADVLVVGAGPAGLAAALAAARSGARVIVVDDQSEPGGSLLAASTESIDDRTALEWVAEVCSELTGHPEVTLLTRTTAFGSYDDNYVLAVEHRTDHLDVPPAHTARQRVWHIRAREVVLATGAHERPLVFANNDRPGIMLAGAVRTYLNRYAVRPGERVVVATTNDSAYELVRDLLDTGIDVAAVVDARPTVAEQLTRLGTRVITGSAVRDTAGAGRVTGVEVAPLTDDDSPEGPGEWIECDTLAVSGGWSPVVHLHSQRQGLLKWHEASAAFVPSGTVPHQHVVGAAHGEFTLAGALAQGTRAGVEAATASGFPTESTAPTGTGGGLGSVRPVWLVPGRSGGPGTWHEHYVDLQRDETVPQVWRAVGAGMRSVEHVKRYTSISTANDQGKTSAVNAIGVIAAALGDRSSPGEIGTTTFRAPFTPVSFAALAGREVGRLFDPERVTPIHRWHVEHGAVFEDVGQWLRPWYYPRAGESMDDAVLRECRAARTGVGMMDATTLGKIEVVGPDAGEFLNRIYTNGFKKLAVGSARYGVMCSVDGMVMDDGVTLRLADDRYFMTTTTGGAAHILEWLEEWLQTEWPDLDVTCTSVTEHWSTIAVVGPRARDVVGRIAPEIDLGNDAFPFMTFRDTKLASGVPARICRISFSGELAYEVNVPGWYGKAVWEQIHAAGQDFDITPYGTETMHVLRAEKGFAIVGQDTDGTVTPQDLGMDWVVSKLKDFVGKRSFDRVDNQRPDRKQLVGLLPVDGQTRIPEGAQLVAETDRAVTPGGELISLGHVTSSYLSAALDSPFALALLCGGRELHGQTVLATVGEHLVPVRVSDPVLYDREGTKRDG